MRLQAALLAVSAATVAAAAQADDENIAGKPEQHWKKLLQSPQANVRMAAASELSRAGKQSTIAAVRLVATALADEDAMVRMTSAYSLARMGPNAVEALDELTKALEDDNARVRMNACDAIGNLGIKAESVVPRICVLARKDKDPHVRQFAAQSLGEIGAVPETSVRLLIDVLEEDTEADVRLTAAGAIGRFGKTADRATVRLARVATSDGDSRVRKAAITTLGTIGHHGGPESMKAVPYLAKALSDPDPEIRRLTAYVLSRFGEASQPAMPKLIETLKGGPPKAQLAAAETLGGLGPIAISAVPALLTKLKQDRFLSLRTAAAESLVRIDPSQLKAVVEILTVATRSEDSGIRMFALDALLRVDKDRELILATLERLRDDELVEIQLRVAESLEYVGEPSATEEQPERSANDEAFADPKVTFQYATQKDADAALATLRTFLAHWENRECAQAAEFADERIRLAWQKNMEQRPIRLRSVDDIHVYNRNNQLRARVHVTVAPKQGIGLDMEFRDGKWWMTGG